MTAMRDRLTHEEEGETSYGFELPVQVDARHLDDDDYFEPNIVRGRE
jgi:hypothetical protein